MVSDRIDHVRGPPFDRFYPEVDKTSDTVGFDDLTMDRVFVEGFYKVLNHLLNILIS